MPDNWAYVFAAYGLAALVLIAYWRHLAQRERELSALADRAGASRDGARTTRRIAPGSGHPRGEPASRTPRP